MAIDAHTITYLLTDNATEAVAYEYDGTLKVSADANNKEDADNHYPVRLFVPLDSKVLQ